MRKKILALCLMTSLLGHTGYSVHQAAEQVKHLVSCGGFSCSHKAGMGIGFGVSGVFLVVGVVLVAVGVHPNAGDAWGITKPCGSGQGLCIDWCTYGCRNTQNQMCEPFGKSCENFCMLTVENYTSVNSVSVCPHNGCQGGAACIPQGQAVVPANLYAPTPKTTWGIPLFGVGVGSAVVGAVAFVTTLFYGLFRV